MLRYSSNLCPSCCLQQKMISTRGKVQGWRYYERNYKGSLTNESELTNQTYRYLMRYILAEINQYLWGTETWQTLYKHHINGGWEGQQMTAIGLSLLSLLLAELTSSLSVRDFNLTTLFIPLTLAVYVVCIVRHILRMSWVGIIYESLHIGLDLLKEIVWQEIFILMQIRVW